MKKKISKILGIAVTIALLTTLIVAAVPASALTLRWFPEGDIPKTTGYKLGTASIAIVDMAANGDTIYVATANTTGGLYKSTDVGDSWSSLESTTFYQLHTGGQHVTNVAVAPDDPDVVVISTDGNKVAYSENGGASWSGLGQPDDTRYSDDANTINDIDVSTGPLRYVVAVGDNGTSGHPVMHKMFMAMAQSWTEEYTDPLNTGEALAMGTNLAVKFSPNYQTDKLIAVVTTNSSTTANQSLFQVFWDESDDWNDDVTGFGPQYPVTVDGLSAQVVAASIAFPDTYLGTDETERIVFVSLATAGTAGGVYRLSDYSIGAAGSFSTWSSGSEGPIGSIAYHESGKLVAGSYTSSKVYSCLSPMGAFPKFQREKTLKQPGGGGPTIVAWSGDTVVAGTSADESAFAVSTDDGLTFNDTALVDTALDTMDDVAVTADGAKLYLATVNGTDASIWLKEASTWKRVLSLDSITNDIIVRVAPDDSNAVYVAEYGTTKVWVSKDGGLENWKEVPCYKADTTHIVDMVVYDADTAYVLDTDGVSKTDNSGASWGEKKSLDGLSTAYDIALAPNGDVLVGGTAGVAFSTDEGASFTKITFPVGAGPVTVIADPDYENNNTIYAGAANSVSGVSVYRMTASKGTIPSSSCAPDLVTDDDMGMTSNAVQGMAVDGDVLYVMTSNGSSSRLYRALNFRTAATTTLALWSYTDSGALLSIAEPNALKMSDGPKFWAIASPNSLYSIVDPIAQVGPTLNAPDDGAAITVNPSTGKAYNVTFSVDRYDSTYINRIQLQIATDEYFEGVIYSANFDSSAIEGNTISMVVGPTGTEYVIDKVLYTSLVDFMPGETYYWRARSNDTDYGLLISAWSAGNSFVIEQADTFTVSGPAVGAADVSLTPTFTWAEYEGAIGYEVMLSEDPTFAIIEWSYNVDNNFYATEEALKYSTTYYWRVRGVTGESTLVGRSWVTPAGPWVTGVFTTMAEPVVEEEEAGEPLVIKEQGETKIEYVEVPTAPVIPTYLLWVIVGVGAVLVIALIVLIVRTRRVA